MRIRDLIRGHRDIPDEADTTGYWPAVDEAWEEQVTQALTAVTDAYVPHGIDTEETLAAIRARAEAETTQQWERPDGLLLDGQDLTDKPVAPRFIPAPAPVVTPPAPPPSPCGGVSKIMVGCITYPDPSDLDYDLTRQYAKTLRHVGAATGTRTSLEDTAEWPQLALEAPRRTP